MPETPTKSWMRRVGTGHYPYKTMICLRMKQPWEEAALQAQQRAERLADQLRALGIEPE